ncbi:MAG TPA: amino acid adenylation domain-containing protein [Pseudonocardiaceae bacterium]
MHNSLTPDLAAAVWADVLGATRLDADAPLAELGADSLDAARVVARLRRRCGLEVDFRVVFEAATPRALADAAAVAGRPVAAEAPLPTADDRELWPLSHDQQRLWLLDQQGGAAAAGYQLPVVSELRGPLDVARLERAWARVVARHGALRTRYVVRGHEPRQEVLAEVPATLPVAEAHGADLAEVLERVADLAAEPFDLAAAPPWRVMLYRLGTDHHVFALVVHHIAFDGWSEEVLRRELAACYGDPDAPLPEPAVRYTDHAVHQREHAAADPATLDHWRRELTGLVPLDLPSDRPRPAVPTGRGAGHDFVIDAPTAAAVRDLARRHGATPFMTLLAAWQALLGRLCDTDDVVVGASTADRGRPELEDLIGMFVNVLVIRSRPDQGRPFGELLDAVRETTLGAFAHRDVPFERLVAELAPDRQAARTPLFSVNFVYLNMPVAEGGWPGLEVRPHTPPARATAFDLILAVQDLPDGTLRGYLEYSTDLFDAGSVARIGRCYTRLLAAVTADPHAPPADADLLGPHDRAALLAAGVAPGPDLPAECLHEVVRRRVAEHPGAIAVAGGGRRLTYAELDAAANRLAHHLRGQGVGPGVGVAVRLPRGTDQVVSMLGVWKAGGYYVPLDEEHPAERVAMMLGDAAPLVLVTRGAEGIAAGEAAGELKVVCLHRDAADLATHPATEPADVGVRPSDLAAAIYTSGSTGTPKAVALTHRNVLSAQAGRTPLPVPRSLLLPVSFAFDVFLSFAAWALVNGGRVVVPVQPRGADLDELAGLLHAEEVSHLVGPPDLQRALLARDDVRGRTVLRAGVVGGQSCPRQLAEDYARYTDGAILVNEYGLTETSAGTYFTTTGADLDDGVGQLPIGVPAPNYRVHLLDRRLRPVPTGVPAEVHIGGPGVARGYLRRPGLTADRFLPDPYGPPGERLYRTGDLARRRGDGSLEFLGRRDRQVKVRGHRIELAELEAALLRHPAVAVAAVVQPEPGGELTGWVVPPEGTPAPAADELRAHLRRFLPDPWVPARFGVLDAMPLTPNGKVDRAALAGLDVTAPTDADAPATAATPVEHAVADVWAEALEIDAAGIDVHADFFAIGGHSMLAASVVSRLRERFPDVTLGMPDLFAAPTVAGLAAIITSRRPEPATGVDAWNDTAREYRLLPLGAALAERVRRDPTRPAVWADGRWSSYAEFGAAVNRLAAHLRRGEVGPGDVVGVCLPRGAALVTAVHAVVTAGAAYLPLPPDLPPARLALMTEDARPAAVITTTGLAHLVGDLPLVLVDADADVIAAERPDPHAVDVPPDALAYVIFTSGSTGRPKGVAVSHRAIADRLAWLQETFPLTAADRVLLKTPFSFDVSVPELFWPLHAGAGLVVAEDGGHRDLDRMAALARDTGVTLAQFVPSVLALLLDEPDVTARLGSLRRVLAAGEALPADLVRAFHAALPHAELHNLYGPTEAAVYATWHDLAGHAGATVPIGGPIANTVLEILTPAGERAPVGEQGELYLGGPGLADGYVGRPELTAERFVPDPFRGAGARLYRTGDLACWLPDGTVEFLGRLDHQVKVRGVRIEPAEVEAALRAHPGVAGAAVVAWRSGADTRLVAYLAGPDLPSAVELRAFLLDRLPAAMVPARFVPLPALPLTASGKLDRGALPDPGAIDVGLIDRQSREAGPGTSGEPEEDVS